MNKIIPNIRYILSGASFVKINAGILVVDYCFVGVWGFMLDEGEGDLLG
ncbi:MAG: hypothetical protein HN352_07015 [Bacteroidetes bacterium]|jgi:hypothetical protein|nr:hypothetical protein [Bacteroidota bacterium]MBT3749484.1 hypothetical protein [Bacteroidota bacterium]MBT4401220.1 hypothetical protein [Bacteroidota bacterium]MBT4411478.1 hypothetical protein [Bacteroidota bacterium]MBT5426916.1 hypothetical protein [Bacteroidota bacterium]